MNIARGNGCTRDDCDHRGRWKGSDRQQDTYSDTTIPYVDAKTAAALCRGGAIAYLPRSNSGITDEWLIEHAVPSMYASASVPRQACLVFGRALVWKVFEATTKPGKCHLVPSQISNRVIAALNDLGERNHLPSGTNPIERENLGVSGLDAELHVFEVSNLNGTTNEPASTEASRGPVRLEQGVQDASVRFMASEIQRLRREVQDARDEAARRDLRNQAQMRNLGKSYSRLASRPATRAVTTNEVEDGGTVLPPSEALVPELSSRPKLLHDLWQEWLVGTTGKKAAKDFTSVERGRVKSKYSFRKGFWDKVDELVQAGHTSDVACDMLYAQYGQSTSVTNVLRAMHADNKSGQWPDALVVCHL